LTLDADLRIILHGVAKLAVEAIYSSVDVFLEELTKGRPQCSGGGGITKYEVEDPLEDGEAILCQARISGGGFGGNVVEKIGATKMYFKEVSMIVVVGGDLD
jgi:hypothetical protein